MDGCEPLNGPRIARIDPRNGEIELRATRRGALLPARDRWPGGRRGGAAGDPPGPSSHAGQQERGGAAPAGGLQDPAREDQAVRHFRSTVPAVLTVASLAPAPWCWRHRSYHGTRLSSPITSLVRAHRPSP